MLADFSADSLLPMYFADVVFRSGSLETFLGRRPKAAYRFISIGKTKTDGPARMGRHGWGQHDPAGCNFKFRH